MVVLCLLKDGSLALFSTCTALQAWLCTTRSSLLVPATSYPPTTSHLVKAKPIITQPHHALSKPSQTLSGFKPTKPVPGHIAPHPTKPVPITPYPTYKPSAYRQTTHP